MKCPNCGLLTKTCIMSSATLRRTVERVRACGECNHLWKTYEVTAEEYNNPRNSHIYIGWSEGELTTLVTLYSQGVNKTEIGRLLGRNRKSIARQLDKLKASGKYFELMEKGVI